MFLDEAFTRKCFVHKEISHKVRGPTRSNNAWHLLVWYSERCVHILCAFRVYYTQYVCWRSTAKMSSSAVALSRTCSQACPSGKPKRRTLSQISRSSRVFWPLKHTYVEWSLLGLCYGTVGLIAIWDFSFRWESDLWSDSGQRWSGLPFFQGLIKWAGLVSVSRDLGTITSPVNQDPGMYRAVRIPPNRAEIFPCNRFYRASPAHQPFFAPIMPQYQARSGLPRFVASAINLAGSPHVIPGWKSSRHTE